MLPLPERKYKIIYADPPWSYRTWTAKGGHKSASAHYDTMSVEQIMDMNVKKIVDKDGAVLFLWATFPNLIEAFDVIKSWGFEYKTVAFTWVKVYSTCKPVIGLGYWTRANAEICLLATSGKDFPRRVDQNVSQIVMSKQKEHSRKPDEVRHRIVKLLGNLPRIELFARNRIEGWDCWGNELSSTVQRCLI